jgi:UPF0271 protein
VVLLNLDAGEHADEPEELWALADVLAIACGGHAGDVPSMTRIVEVCVRRGIGIGAHPSYPDREGFGRRSMQMKPGALRAAVATQCGALASVARGFGHEVQWIKPHGALYHDVNGSAEMSRELVAGVTTALGNVVVIGPPRGRLHEAATDAHLCYFVEGFADRATRSDGTLVPRSEAGALITDPQLAAARARELAGKVDMISVHADTPGALEIARAVREAIYG